MRDADETPREPRFRHPDEDLGALLSEWRKLGRRCLEEVEQFTRERPAAGLAAAFLAGTFVASILRRP